MDCSASEPPTGADPDQARANLAANGRVAQLPVTRSRIAIELLRVSPEGQVVGREGSND